MNSEFKEPPSGPSYGYGASYGGYGDGAGVDSGGTSIDVRRVLETLRKHFWIIIVYLVAGVAAAVAYLNVAIPIYQSFAMLKVEQRVENAAPLMGGGGTIEDLRAIDAVGTIVQGFLSRTLMEQVVDKLNLTERPEFLGEDVPEAERTEGRCIGELRNNIEAEIIRGTRLIRVSFDHPNPDIAVEVTDALIREYIALDGEQRLASASTNISYLIEERKALEEKLRKSEEKLGEYVQKLGSVSVGNEVNIIAQQLMDLNSRLTAAKSDRLKLEADFEQIQEYKDDPGKLLEIPSVAAIGEIQSLRTQINEVDAEISRMSQRYGEKNPAIEQLHGRKNALETALEIETRRAPQMIELVMRAARQNENSLEREADAQEKKTIQVKQLAVQSSVIERQIEADKLAFQSVLQKLNEETSQARSQPVFLQIVDPASPAFQVAPKPVIVAALALIGALGLSAFTIFMIAFLDTSIKSVDETERLFGVPVLAAVPQISNLVRRVGKKNPDANADKLSETSLPLLEDPFSTVSEAFRTFRASLLLLEDEQPYVLVTSAVPGEGKSFCALNLSVAMSQQDFRTVLIDADLRKPVIEGRIFDSTDKRGLADFLMGKVELEEILHECRVPGLWIIPAGTSYSNASELLSRRERVASLLSMLNKRFDRIVVDSAPILAVSDTLALARHFKTIALVLRSHKTPRRFSKRAVDLLERSTHPVSGIVLNQVPAKGASYQFYYYRDDRTGGAYGSDVQKAPANNT